MQREFETTQNQRIGIVWVDDFDDNLIKGTTQRDLMNGKNIAKFLSVRRKNSISIEEAQVLVLNMSNFPHIIDEVAEDLRSYGLQREPLWGEAAKEELCSMFQKLKAVGVPYCIASYTFKPVVEGYLEKSGISQDDIATISIHRENYSGQFDKNKLLQEIIEEKKVNPNQIIFFDDTFRNVQVARNLGIHAIWTLPQHPEISLRTRQIIINTITAVKPDQQNSQLIEEACQAAAQYMLGELEEKMDLCKEKLRDLGLKRSMLNPPQPQPIQINPSYTQNVTQKNQQIDKVGLLTELSESLLSMNHASVGNLNQRQQEILRILIANTPSTVSIDKFLTKIKNIEVTYINEVKKNESSSKPLSLESKGVENPRQSMEGALSRGQQNVVISTSQMELTELQKLDQEISITNKELEALNSTVHRLKLLYSPNYEKNILAKDALEKHRTLQLAILREHEGFMNCEINFMDVIKKLSEKVGEQERQMQIQQQENTELKQQLEKLQSCAGDLERELQEKVMELQQLRQQQQMSSFPPQSTPGYSDNSQSRVPPLYSGAGQFFQPSAISPVQEIQPQYVIPQEPWHPARHQDPGSPFSSERTSENFSPFPPQTNIPAVAQPPQSVPSPVWGSQPSYGPGPQMFSTSTTPSAQVVQQPSIRVVYSPDVVLGIYPINELPKAYKKITTAGDQFIEINCSGKQDKKDEVITCIKANNIKTQYLPQRREVIHFTLEEYVKFFIVIRIEDQMKKQQSNSLLASVTSFVGASSKNTVDLLNIVKKWALDFNLKGNISAIQSHPSFKETSKFINELCEKETNFYLRQPRQLISSTQTNTTNSSSPYPTQPYNNM